MAILHIAYCIKSCVVADNSVSSNIQELPELAVGARKVCGIQEVLSLKIFLPKIFSRFLSALNFGTHKNTVSQNKLNSGVCFTKYIVT